MMFMKITGRDAIDLDEVRFSDGVRGSVLSREECFNRCVAEQVKGVAPSMGRNCLLEAYAKHRRQWGEPK
jgi:hypothetical protein